MDLEFGVNPPKILQRPKTPILDSFSFLFVLFHSFFIFRKGYFLPNFCSKLKKLTLKITRIGVKMIRFFLHLE